MKITSIELDTVCGITSKLPENTLTEVAFAGRSNVGKSSLLNTLVNRKALARTSATPGKTQTINYYLLNKVLYLVDLPGYGYTKASVSAKQQWGKMVENYLNTSKSLKVIFLLVDIRHAPTKDDCMMYDWIVHKGIRPVIIATKADKIKRSQYKKQEKLIRTTLNAGEDTKLIVFSSLGKFGTEDVYQVFLELIDQDA